MVAVSAEEAFRSGDPDAALVELQERVRRDPGNAKLRVFLAQLLLVQGTWDRAWVQLGVAAELDAEAVPMAHAYRSAIQCERVRAGVFNGERSPLIFGDPEPWIAGYLKALLLQCAGKATEAADVRSRSAEDVPQVAGTANTSRCEFILDADARIGPILEVYLNGGYYWVPMSRIRRLVVEAPSDIRDLVWLAGQFTWTNGGEAYGMVPVRYPGSESSGDPAIRMARKTEWTEPSAGTFVGSGQRMLMTETADIPILELRELLFENEG